MAHSPRSSRLRPHGFAAIVVRVPTTRVALLLYFLGAAAAVSCVLPSYSVGEPGRSTGSSSSAGGGGTGGATTSSTGTSSADGGSGGCPPPCSAMCGDGVGQQGELCLTPGDAIPVAPPVALAVGDLDGDELADIVIASAVAVTGTVSVLRGLGNGTFALQPSVDVGLAPTSLVLAYMDSGNSLDVIVGHQGGVTMLLTASTPGTVSFQAQTLVTLPGVVAVAATDLAGNGPRDIAAATADSSIHLLTNDGNATLSAGIVVLVPALPAAIATDDINNDGLYDLAVAGTDGSVTLLLQQAGGYVISTGVQLGQVEPVALALSDLDGMGGLDLVTANHGSATVSLCLNAGDGSFPVATSLPTPAAPRGLIVADLDNDGTRDIAVSGQTTGEIALLLGGKSGLVPGPVFSGFAGPSALATGDFNRDGFPDLVIAEAGADRVSVLLSNP